MKEIDYNKEKKKTYSNYSLNKDKRVRTDSCKYTTIDNRNFVKKKKKVSFNVDSKTLIPLSSFHQIKISEKM